MFRRFKFLLAWRWLLLYVVSVVAVIAMVLLGRWQLHRAHQNHGSLQNYSYVLQWWAFSCFTIFMLVKLVRDALDQRRAILEGRPTPEPVQAADQVVGYRRYVPPSSPHQELDPTQMAYNDYLASLARRDAGEERR